MPSSRTAILPHFALLLLLLALAAPRAAAAEEADGEAESWTPRTLTLVHGGDSGRTHCQIQLAHWFEVAFGPAGPDSPAELPLLTRVASGEVALPNAEGRRMRLERIDCGAETTPRDRWASLSIDPLRRGSGPLVLECRGDGAGAACHWHP